MPYHHGDLRNTILGAARNALKLVPPEDLSLRQLAKEAAVSANAPYRHFKERDDLLEALAIDGFRTLTAQVHEASAATNSDRDLATRYSAFATTEPGLYRLMFRKSSGERSPALTEAIEELFAELMAILEKGHDPGDPEQSLRRAVGAWSSLHGAVLFSLDGTLDWLDAWLKPTGGELIAATTDGFRRARSARRGDR